MLRYLRLYAAFCRFSFSKALEFRVDFFLRIFMDVVYYAVNIAFFKILYRHVSALGGWTEDQVMVFIALYLVVDAVHMTIFANNMWTIPMEVNRGGLDYYLVRPVSTLFFVSLRDVAVASLINLVMAIGILVWAVSLNPAIWTGKLLALPLLLANGVLLHWLMAMLFMIPVFWTHSNRGLTQLYYMLMRFAERPDRIYAGAVRVFVTTIMPFALVASFPARLILDAFEPMIALHLGLVTVGMALLVRWFWGRGLRAYSSASS
jgi:ABC-2 type transport system permease protein